MQMSADLMDRLPSFESPDDYYKGITVREASLWAVKADESVTIETRINCFAHCRVSKDPASTITDQPAEENQELRDFTSVFEDEEDPFETEE